MFLLPPLVVHIIQFIVFIIITLILRHFHFSPAWGWGTFFPPFSPLFIHFFILCSFLFFRFSLALTIFFFLFLFLFLSSIAFLSTRNVLLRTFQSGCRRKRPNLGLVEWMNEWIYSLDKIKVSQAGTPRHDNCVRLPVSWKPMRTIVKTSITNKSYLVIKNIQKNIH